MDNQKLIIHLIREQNRNRLLINSLENIGFDCTYYSLNISKEILTLVGFQEIPDKLYHWYFELIDQAIEETTFWNLDEMSEEWSVKIYDGLMSIKSEAIYQ